MIEEIKAYKCEDGHFFDNEKEAKAHDAELMIVGEFNEDFGYDTRFTGQELINFVKANRDQFISLLENPD